MKFYTYTFSIIIILCFTYCKQKESIGQIQLPKENLEFNSFSLEQMGRKSTKVILENSKAYKKLEKYVFELDSLRITDRIEFHPSYTIVSDSFKLSLNPQKLGIEYINKNSKHIKLIKDIHYNEIFSLGSIGSLSKEMINLGDFYGIGKFKRESYTFCGIVASEVRYFYKDGYWKFLNKKKQLVAEGIFDTFTDTVQDHGGCFYVYKYSKIDLKKWKFYNEKKDSISPSLSLIHQLEKTKKEYR